MKNSFNFPSELFQAPSVTANSHEVMQGGIFVAIEGQKFNGNNFINEAISKGAAFIISETQYQNIPVHFIKVDNARDALNFLISKIYTRAPENIIAVTGTNGKTSIVNIVRQLLTALGKKAASIGSLGIIGLGNSPIETGINTPHAADLAKHLDTLAKHNIEYVAMEASSHGLDQERVRNIHFKAAAFTNLTQDHLDYHLTFENYFNAKMQLFSKYMQNGTAVINIDIDQFGKIEQTSQQNNNKIISYGKSSSADLRLINSRIIGSKQEIDFTFQNSSFQVSIPLFGTYQAYNLLAAIGLLLALDFEIEAIAKATRAISEIPGRMELVSDFNDKYIFIDYSHSTDSLEKALETLIELERGKLWLLFGCGGDRDKEKRPQMGLVATKFADHIIVTDDNPRTESPSQIRSEILATCQGAIEIDDRKAAINYAIANMQPGDTLLIAGKGHEKYQIIGDKSLPFDEHQIVKEIVSQNGSH